VCNCAPKPDPLTGLRFERRSGDGEVVAVYNDLWVARAAKRPGERVVAVREAA